MTPSFATPRSLLLLFLLMIPAVSFGQFTETPFPRAPGKFLLEVDAIDLSIDRNADFDYSALGLGTVLLSMGVTPTLDLEVGAQLYYRQRIEYDTFTDSESGLGAVQLRVKWQFYADGGSAAAVIPYIRVPTDDSLPGNEAVEGGVIVPWTASLPAGFQFVAQGQVDFQRNPADDGYDIAWGAAAFLRRDLPAGFGLYGEAITYKSSGGEDFAGSLGAGVTWDTVIGTWDYAMYKGLSNGAADWTYTLRYRIGF